MATLFQKWHNAKLKADKAIAKERHLRDKMEQHYLKKDTSRFNFESGNNKVAVLKNTNYYIASSKVLDLREKLTDLTFEKLFYSSYKIREAQYLNLSGKERKKVDKVMEIRPALCTITIKEK